MRVRITAFVALLLGVAMAGAGLIVYAIELQRIEEQMIAEVDQEFAEFGRLAEEGIDPETGEPFAGAGPLLDTFLSRNVPDDIEVLVSWYGGRPRFALPDRTFAQLPVFEPTVRPLVRDNGVRRVQVDGYGEVLVAVQSVRVGDTTGALVVVTFLDRGRAGLHDTMRTYAVVAALSLLLVTALAFWLSGRLLAPLRTLRETAEEISETDLSRRIPETGNDDITALTRTVNGMLARLEAAFEGQREFLDDAGHELRTPLTVLRGHLELIDQGDPEDVAETRALLLDEVDRMSRLVGDLILLAKSRRPDFLAARTVGVERLTHTLLAKARALGDREWVLDGAADLLATVDEQRITQAVLQLADNAVKHTQPGDVVALGSSYDDGWLRIWVRDTGPGVPPDDQDHIFSRFGRSQVRPGDEGFGLGLSIVDAIAEAHGGFVHYEDAEPHGACFIITLPHREDAWPTS